MFAAVLDTCVLWPSLQRDFLLSMAVERLYRPLWSEAILEELHRHEQRKLVRRGREEPAARVAADHLLTRMRTYFDDALVFGWEPLDGSFGLPDVDDEHVVAAAVVGGAGVIVTDNLKHFPPAVVPGHIQVLNGRTFASNTADVDPQRAARALCEISRRSHRGQQTPAEILSLLVRNYGMDDVAEVVLPILDEVAAGYE